MMMKGVICFGYLCLSLLLLGCATQQERAERREKMQQTVTEAVEKRQWHIDVTTMHTMRYGARTVTPDFYLELHGDTIRSYLPYMGQVHRAPMVSPSQGLNFEARIQNYEQRTKKNQGVQMDMDVKTDEDSYHYSVELYGNGQAYIQVRSQHSDPVSFDGHFD